MAKKMKRKTLIIPIAAASVLSIGLIVGTSIAYNYADLIDVFLTRSNYSASNDAKQLCEDVVGEGLVLLKNEDKALPLSASEKSVALYGQDSVDFVYGGSGSGSVDTSMAPNLKQAFEDAGFTVNQTLWDFYSTGPGKGYRKQTPDEAGHGAGAHDDASALVYAPAADEFLDRAAEIAGGNVKADGNININAERAHPYNYIIVIRY